MAMFHQGNRELQQQFGRAACRRYALDRFQWSLVAERTAQVYRKVLGVRS